jgi:hypothetical protein
MDADALTPRALFDGNVCYEIPPFQRPYVWSEEDQWQPLWDDVQRVTERWLELQGSGSEDAMVSHFMGAVVLKFQDTPAGEVARRSVIDGQQRLTTLQLLLDAAQLVTAEHGDEEDAESLQELVYNSARRFRDTPSRFKLWPSRIDRTAFEYVMDNELDVSELDATSRISEAHSFFIDSIRAWADIEGGVESSTVRLSALAKVLQQNFVVVSINLSANDDDQLIFETLNNRGTPLLAADLIKNYVFQKCELLGADVDEWSEDYWQGFDEDWWREEVSQGRLLRSRIDMFLQYWLTMRLQDEVTSETVFIRFRHFAADSLASKSEAKEFLGGLKRDAGLYRDFVTNESESEGAAFYGRVVESLELGTFIPLLLWLVSDHHEVPEPEVQKALDSIESFVIRRMLLRMTTKDYNSLVVAILKEASENPVDHVGTVIENFLAIQTADARLWPTDDSMKETLPGLRLYGNVKQSRLRIVLSAVEMHLRNLRHEDVTLPAHLEIEHVMPRAWRTYWGVDVAGDNQLASQRDRRVDSIGNLTLVTKKLNGTLSHRPWSDAEATPIFTTGKFAGKGKRSLLSNYSVLVLNKKIIDEHEEEWTESDIRARARVMTETVILIWPRPASVEA